MEECKIGYGQLLSKLYFAVLAVMMLIILLNIFLRDGNHSDYGQGEFYDLDTGWSTKMGVEFEIQKIDELRTEESDSFSIFHRLPESIGQNKTIVFRSKNCFVTVLVDGIPVYKTDVGEAPFYNHSPGTRWNMVLISQEDGGKDFEIQIRQAYEDGRAKVDNFYYGDRAAILLHLIQAKIGGFVVSLLILFVGILFFSVWIILNWHRSPMDNSLLWLAIFAVVASTWCLLETNLFQLFFDHLPLIQVVDNMMLVIGGFPLFMYLDCVLHIFRYRFVRILCGLDMAYLIFATVSQLMGWWDFHQTLNGAVITYGVVGAILIGCLIGKNKGSLLLGFSQKLGILLLGMGLLGDLIRYLTTDVLDRAFIIRIGLLGFIVCFGAGNIYQMTLLVKKGMEMDLISRLAYSDGLTRVGNRTAYIECLQNLERESTQTPFALVMFDINDLKKINDTLGHKMGDKMIQDCANLICSAFSPPWQIFRVGGDEFIALFSGDDAKFSYQKAAEEFQNNVNAYHGRPDSPYPIMIAHGAAFGEAAKKGIVEMAEQDADRKMYLNKAELRRAGGGTGYR